MKKIYVLLSMAIVISCSNDDLVKDNIKDNFFVFQRNTDVRTPGIYTKLYQADVETGELLNEIGGYESLQARIYYEITKVDNEILTKRNVFEGGRGNELVKFNLNTGKKIVVSQNDNIYDITVVNNRIFGFKLNSNSADLVEIDELGNILSTIETFKDLPNAPSNMRRGLDKLTFSEGENMLILNRRLSFVGGAIDKLFTYNVRTKESLYIDVNHYESIISGNKGRIFALKTVKNSSGNYYSKLIEFNKNTGEELKDVFVFNEYILSEELIFLSSTNEIVIKNIGFGLSKINVDSGKEKSISLNYDYRDISALNMTRVLSH
jgi:hypothetical protein